LAIWQSEHGFKKRSLAPLKGRDFSIRGHRKIFGLCLVYAERGPIFDENCRRKSEDIHAEN
jgi:hypothetical protein